MHKRQFSSNLDFSVKVMIEMGSLMSKKNYWSNDRNGISNVKKNYWKKKKKKKRKMKYWRRNGGFTFWPQVRVTRLIDILSAVFSNFFTWRGHFKELKLKGNLSVCPQIWTVARLTYKRQKRFCEFFYFEILFLWERFLYDHFTFFLILFRKCAITFHCNWVWHNADTRFWVQKLSNKLN